MSAPLTHGAGSAGVPGPRPSHDPRGSTTGRRRSAGSLVLGGLLIAAGVVWFAESAGLVDVNWRTTLAVVVLVLGAALLATARSARLGGLIPVGVVLAAVLVVTSAMPRLPIGSGLGDREVSPTSVAELQDRYELGAGTLRLDLRGLVLDGESAATEVTVGLGEVTLLVPDDVAVDVRATAGIGGVDVLGVRRDGVAPRVEERRGGDEGRLELDLAVGLGSIEVRS